MKSNTATTVSYRRFDIFQLLFLLFCKKIASCNLFIMSGTNDVDSHTTGFNYYNKGKPEELAAQPSGCFRVKVQL